jgi:integrase
VWTDTAGYVDPDTGVPLPTWGEAMSIRARQTRRGRVYDVRLRGLDGNEVSRTFTTKRAAILWEAEQRAAKLRGGWVDPQKAATITLEQLAGDWLEANPAKRESSLAREEIALKRHILPALGGRKVATIKPADVQGVVNGWKAAMAPSTVARTYSVLRAVLNLAVDRELLLRSPARGTRLPSVAAPQRRLPTLEDVVALAEAHPDEYEPMVWLGAVLGLRWGEVAGLRVGRVDVLRRTLTVAESLSRGRKGRSTVTAPKSEAGRRTLTVPAELATMLGDHLAARGLTGADADSYVFVAPQGGPLRHSNWLRRVWQPACVTAGLGRMVTVEGRRTKRYEGPGLHDLRRVNATALVAEGVDVKTAQARLGHSNPRLTLAIYAQSTEAADKAAADAMGARFLGARDERGMAGRSRDGRSA